ncbi:MAG: DUF4830 domain-containing protein [Bacillota bacterium]
MKKAISFLLTLFILILLVGCNSQADEHGRKLLAQYRLHPAGAPEAEKIKLEERYFEIYNSASKDIGLDLQKYKGKEVKALSYVLRERSQFRNQDGEITAHVLFFKGDLIGAYLILKGYCPGVSSLKDRTFFAPSNKLKPTNLRLKGVNKIDLFGPWVSDKWKNKATLETPSEIYEFISLVNQSVSRREEFTPVIGDEEYLIKFYYTDGPVVYGRLAVKATKTRFTLDMFPGWSYDPPEELKPYVKEKLGAM